MNERRQKPGERRKPRPGEARPGQPRPGQRRAGARPRRRRKSEEVSAQPAQDENPNNLPRGRKAFEIRKGSSGESSAELDPVQEDPITSVALPKSITQEAEENRFRDRFGVEGATMGKQQHGNVVLNSSAGTTGPDRMGGGGKTAIAVLLLLIGAAAVGWWLYQNKPELFGAG
ncbi:hypothetical protein OAX78_01750 [Planctomycetota bacterium]|nr:hypothetical protein [Planctomycetota bacterium]